MHGTVGADKAVIFIPDLLTCQSAAVGFFPTLRDFREDVVMGDPTQIAIAQSIVGPKTWTHDEVAHLAVEHRQRRWRVLDEEPEPLLALTQRILGHLACADVTRNGHHVFAIQQYALQAHFDRESSSVFAPVDALNGHGSRLPQLLAYPRN